MASIRTVVLYFGQLLYSGPLSSASAGLMSRGWSNIRFRCNRRPRVGKRCPALRFQPAARERSRAIGRLRLDTPAERLCRSAGGLRLQPALGIDRRHAARAGCGDGLSIDAISHITGGKYALDVGVGRAGTDLEIAEVVHIELALENRRVGLVAD